MKRMYLLLMIFCVQSMYGAEARPDEGGDDDFTLVESPFRDVATQTGNPLAQRDDTLLAPKWKEVVGDDGTVMGRVERNGMMKVGTPADCTLVDVARGTMPPGELLLVGSIDAIVAQLTDGQAAAFLDQLRARFPVHASAEDEQRSRATAALASGRQADSSRSKDVGGVSKSRTILYDVVGWLANK